VIERASKRIRAEVAHTLAKIARRRYVDELQLEIHLAFPPARHWRYCVARAALIPMWGGIPIYIGRAGTEAERRIALREAASLLLSENG